MTSEPKRASRLEYQRRWRALNKEKVRHYEKTYQKNHPEQYQAKERRHAIKRLPRLKAYRKAYRKKNLETVRRKNREWQQRQKLHRREYMKKYYQSNPEKFRERSSKWWRANPGRHAIHVIKRRRKQADCPPQETAIINTWMLEVRTKPFARCYWCGTKVLGADIHFDHIIALSKGGSHSISNLCAACPDCNRTKHARIIADWVVGGQTFLSL